MSFPPPPHIAAELLVLAHLHNAENLLRFALEFVAGNLTAVRQTPGSHHHSQLLIRTRLIPLPCAGYHSLETAGHRDLWVQLVDAISKAESHSVQGRSRSTEQLATT